MALRMGGLAALVFVLAGCLATTTDYRYPQDLSNPNYVKRTQAVDRFARDMDRSRLPDAFQLLLDDEGQIRLVAHRAIAGMTPGGEDFGYRPFLEAPVREGIVSRWRAFWIANSGVMEASRGARG